MEPASSIGSQGRNVPFREDIVESAIRPTVLVANSHTSVPSHLEMVDIDAFWPPSSETLPRVQILIRNGVEHAETQPQVPHLLEGPTTKKPN